MDQESLLSGSERRDPLGNLAIEDAVPQDATPEREAKGQLPITPSRNSRRTYGTGSIIEKNGHYYGQWRLNGRLIKRKLGPIRKPGTREGMTKTMAESKLRSLIEDTVSPPPVVERMTVEEAGTRLITHLATMRRKPSTTESYESYLRIHIGPYFESRPITQITKEDVESFAAACLNHGQSVKSTLNYLGLLHGIFEFAIRRGWATANPVKLVEKPKNRDEDPDIRFLDQTELDALLAAVPDDDLGRVERVMYMSAAMTGMRQGELLALRWLDVDWVARRIRVRLNFVRGRTGTPKSKRSSRSVPLADVLDGELDLLHQRSAFSDDEDLVFAHPHTGKPIDRSKLLKRYKRALKRAGVRDVRFHEYATHIRDAHGCSGRADADAAGVDGPPGLQDDADLRGLRTQPRGGRPGQRRLPGHQSGHQFERKS